MWSPRCCGALRGSRYRAAMLEEAGYVWNADKTRKTKLYTEEYVGLDKQGNKEARKRQAMIYWDQADADMARARREEKLVMAQRACENGAYGIKKGSQEYVLEEIVHPQTGGGEGGQTHCALGQHKEGRTGCERTTGALHPDQRTRL